jgi:hypothetical protein
MGLRVGSRRPSGKVLCAGRVAAVRRKVSAMRGRWIGIGVV